MLRRPEPWLTERILYDPTTVEDRGWLVMLNCIVSTHYALHEGYNSTLARQCRWNTWLALDEGGVFLEPSLVKIQAFMILSNHGQEYSTPSMSWNFINHACRMMQAIGLPDPRTYRGASKDDRVHRQMLFWSVYATDRTLATAFGRPACLPESICERVPFPSASALSGFDPHFSPAEKTTQEQSTPGAAGIRFGANYFCQALKLFRIVGKIVDILFSSRRTRLAKPNKGHLGSEVRLQLKEWLKETERVRDHHESKAVARRSLTMADFPGSTGLPPRGADWHCLYPFPVSAHHGISDTRS